MPKAKAKVKNSTKINNKIKTKVKRKWTKKMEYRCVAKTETVVHVNFQERNENGALNTKIMPTAYFHIVFQYHTDLNKVLSIGEDAPKVLMARFEVQTSNKEAYDKYSVGKTYKDLPVNV